MKKKKVLFVINTLGHAGAEVALLELLGRLEGTNLELSVYVLTDQGELADDLPPGVKLLNQRYCRSSVLSGEGRRHLRKKVLSSFFTRMSGLKNLPYLIRNGGKMIAKRKLQADKLLWRVLSDGGQVLTETYDLAVAYLEGGAAYFVADHVKAARKAAFVHIDYRLAGYTRALDKDVFLRFDRVFTVSGEVREQFLAVYPECEKKTFVFHNLLNEERIRKRSLEEGGFSDGYSGIRLLTVGRLVYQKAYDVAIETMKLLKETGLPLRWYVLGEGDLRGELERQIRELDLTEDFVLLGADKNPFPYYAQADIYVHLTRFEGKSIAIQEAQVLGKPIVASDCSGNREQIENGVDGILCPLSPEEACRAITLLVRDRELAEKYGAAATGKQRAYEEDIQMLLELLDNQGAEADGKKRFTDHYAGIQ